MDSISSSYATRVPELGKYERDVKTVGPLAASLIGVADTAKDAVSSTYAFSSKALEALAQSASEGYETVSHGLHTAVDSVEGAVSNLGTEAEAAGQAVEAWARSGLSSVESAAHDTYTAIQSGVNTVSQALTSVGDEVSEVSSAVVKGVESAVNTVGNYAGMAVVAVQDLV
ncbi:hypothetical protein [Roseateles koreensis]|uniref:Uncharacterized protein n=1 Tax=Roseateles koreensis TaxID=2987526 RepID=A0ABT5KN72_9BURK|nr:hypothetical protein [Roseateles koreensis]MDC8783860.1 hypothetical protein [Roseateles koreensis]